MFDKVKKLVRVFAVICIASIAMYTAPKPAQAQAQGRPFSLPFAAPPGPTTWLMGQAYGNTTGAYNSGKFQYAAGQGLHFGIDISAPCGTPVVAIGDGEIDQVDNFSFGILPHNVTIFHRELGLTSLYGHLLSKPTVVKGQPVKKGDIIAHTGDPDLTCQSRPHLHLEVRSRDYTIAHNPSVYIDADWSMLNTFGFGGGGYAKDLFNPNRWQTIGDQPNIDFNEATLNNSRAVWPPASRNQPPSQTLPLFVAPLLGDAAPTFRQLTQSPCCSRAWWSPDSRAVRYWNGPEGQRAQVNQVDITAEGSAPQITDFSPVASLDGQYEVRWDSGRVSVRRFADNSLKALMTGSAWPRPSPGSTKIMWHYLASESVPGGAPPATEIWVANPDGSGLIQVATPRGGSVSWLDDDRVLLSQRQDRSNMWNLSIYTLSTRQAQPLLTAKNLRGMSVSPGGHYILYYLAFQDNPADSGIYLLETRPGAMPVKMPFFGSWRWRDSLSLIYIPFELGKPIVLTHYDVTTGKSRPLIDPATQPVGIINDDWSVSPNGQHIVFWNTKDLALWLITLPAQPAQTVG
jgi:murein DD-endopeptidase MepM/ murein hydrolase activator NlpD